MSESITYKLTAAVVKKGPDSYDAEVAVVPPLPGDALDRLREGVTSYMALADHPHHTRAIVTQGEGDPATIVSIRGAKAPNSGAMAATAKFAVKTAILNLNSNNFVV